MWERFKPPPHLPSRMGSVGRNPFPVCIPALQYYSNPLPVYLTALPHPSNPLHKPRAALQYPSNTIHACNIHIQIPLKSSHSLPFNPTLNLRAFTAVLSCAWSIPQQHNMHMACSLSWLAELFHD